MSEYLSEAEYREIARKHYAQWMISVMDGLKIVYFTRQESMSKKAAFIFHQVTEHLFACALLTCTNYLPKSHNIEKLGHLCVQIDPTFVEIFPMDNKLHRRSFRRLQRAYIDARCPEPDFTGVLLGKADLTTRIERKL